MLGVDAFSNLWPLWLGPSLISIPLGGQPQDSNRGQHCAMWAAGCRDSVGCSEDAASATPCLSLSKLMLTLVKVDFCLFACEAYLCLMISSSNRKKIRHKGWRGISNIAPLYGGSHVVCFVLQDLQKEIERPPNPVGFCPQFLGIGREHCAEWTGWVGWCRTGVLRFLWHRRFRRC